MFNGVCTYCHEEIYIEDQYIEIDMEVPEIISEKAEVHRQKIEQREIIKKLLK